MRKKAENSWDKKSNRGQIMMVVAKTKLVIQLVIWKIEWLWWYELVIGTKGGDGSNMMEEKLKWEG